MNQGLFPNGALATGEFGDVESIFNQAGILTLFQAFRHLLYRSLESGTLQYNEQVFLVMVERSGHRRAIASGRLERPPIFR